MNRFGHHVTGAISGAGVAGYLGLISPESAIQATVCVIGGWHGGVFPDAVEHIRGRYWIKHRTITHWAPAWLALIGWLVLANPDLPAHTYSYPALLAFALGGLTHLLFDWPNPTGIPWIHPWKRHSLGLWKSGRADLILVLMWGTSIGAVAAATP